MRYFNTMLKQKANIFRRVTFFFRHGTSIKLRKCAIFAMCYALSMQKGRSLAPIRTGTKDPAYEEIQDEIVLLLERAGKVFLFE